MKKTTLALLAMGLMTTSAFAADLPVRHRHVEYAPVAPVVEPAPLVAGVPGVVTVEPLPWWHRPMFPFNPLPNVDVFGFRVLGDWGHHRR